MLLYILDSTFKVLGTLTTKGTTNKTTPFFNSEFAMDLTSGAMVLKFDTFANTFQSPSLVTGNYIAFQFEGVYRLFQIFEVTQTHDTSHTKSIYCEMCSIELLNQCIRPANLPSVNLKQAMEFALQDTEYSVGYVDGSITEVYTIELSEPTTAYQFIQDYVIGKFGAEISYRVDIRGGQVVGKYIDCYSQIGVFNGLRFEYSKSITSVKKTEDSTELVTALIPTGKDGLTIKEVEADDKPLAQDWVGDEDAYKLYNRNGRHIFGNFKYDTDSAYELYNQAKKELAELCKPKLKYEVDVELLGKEVGLGDTVYIVDHDFEPPLHLSARVSQKKIYFDDRKKDKVILANYKEVVSKIDDEIRQVASLIDSKFPIGSSDIQNGAVTSEKIPSNAIQSSHIVQSSITTDHLQANSVTTDKLEANSVTADKIQADSISADKLQANSVTADKIMAGSISSIHIQAHTITADNIATGTITAGSGVIAEGAIGNAQISSLEANKIESGTIDTSKVTVQGANGNLKIKGNRLQVFTGTGTSQYERVSLGDVNGDGTVYGFRVRGKDGKTMLMDENGVTSEGITDGSITNEKISDNAYIDGAKININSVVNEINKDGTEVIKGYKISVNGTNLETKLTSLTNTQTSQGETIKSNTARIEANENSIKLKVDSQTYTTDKQAMTSTLEKHTSDISLLKDEISLKASSTTVSTLSGKVDSLTSRVSTAELKITPEAILNSVNTQISNGGQINTVSTVLDKTGFTVNNGALTIKNNLGNKVLYGDTSGNLTLAGNITSGATITGGSLKSTNGDLSFNLNSGYMLLYNNGSKVGQTQKNNIVNTNIYGVSNGAEYGCYSSLGAKTSADASTYTSMLLVTGSDLATNMKKGVNLGADLIGNKWNIKDTAAISWTNDAGQDSRIYGSSSDNSLVLRCTDTNSVIISCNHSTAGHNRVADFSYNTSDTSGINFWRGLNMHGYSITNAKTLSVNTLTTSDVEIIDPIATYSKTNTPIKYSVTKSIVANTEYFGTAKVIDGVCEIPLPEGMEGSLGYMVVLTPIGKKEIWLEDKGENSFKVAGEDCTFDYLIKCNSPSVSSYSLNAKEETPPTLPLDEFEGVEILTEG